MPRRVEDTVKVKCSAFGELRISYPAAVDSPFRMERLRDIDSPRPQHAEADDFALSYEYDLFQGSTGLSIDNPAPNTNAF